MKTRKFLFGLFCVPLLASCSFVNTIKEKLFPSKEGEEAPKRIEITDKEERKNAVAEIKAAINKTFSADSYKMSIKIPYLVDIQMDVSIDCVHQNYLAEASVQGQAPNKAYGEMYEGKLAIYNEDSEDHSWYCVEYEKEEFIVDTLSGLGLQSSSMEDELADTIRLYKEGDFYIQELGGTKDALIESYKEFSEEYQEKINEAAKDLEDFQLIIGIKDGYYVYEEYIISYLEPEYSDSFELLSVKAHKEALYIGSFTEINTLVVTRPEGVTFPPVVEEKEHTEEPYTEEEEPIAEDYEPQNFNTEE